MVRPPGKSERECGSGVTVSPAVDEAICFVNCQNGGYARPTFALAFPWRPHHALISRMHFGGYTQPLHLTVTPGRYAGGATWRSGLGVTPQLGAQGLDVRF